MKSNLEYFIAGTNILSNCGDVLNISQSSYALNWKGVLVERGTSPYFHPKDVETNYFYFAIELSNEYAIEVEGEEIKSFYFGPEDIWFNPPKTPFTHNIDEQCDFVIVAIDAAHFFAHSGIKQLSTVEYLNNYSLKDAVLRQLIMLLYSPVQSDQVVSDAFIDQVIRLIVDHVTTYYSNYNDLLQKQEYTAFSKYQREVIEQYIETHIEESIRIDDLAQLLKMSKFAFLREYKHSMGITPYQYILEKKIAYAKELLKLTNFTITDIAYRLAFNDASHFTRTFKKIEGMTPKAYRGYLKFNTPIVF